MTLNQNLLEKRSQLYWLRFEPLIFRLQATCAIHYAMKYLLKLIVQCVQKLPVIVMCPFSQPDVDGFQNPLGSW